MSTSFIFTYGPTNEVHTFNSPQEAIEFFNKKGYGMSNWDILLEIRQQSKKDPMFDTVRHSKIDLVMFNYLTDTWDKLPA